MTDSMLLAIEQVGGHLLGMVEEYKRGGGAKYGSRKDIIFGLHEFAWKINVAANVLETQIETQKD